MTPANLLTEWAGLLVDSLVAAGVRDVVISPGSRSTAWVLAAVAHDGLRVHTCLDERAAAFFALGQARVTGRPTVLLCTSGTAGAHYLPAVVEASLARIPLVVLTADRPPELADCGAPQTIDQTRLFGVHVRSFVELGLPDPTPHLLRATRRRAVQAVLATRWPDPGPVHVNVRARKPFEPTGPDGAEGTELAARVAALRASPVPRAPVPSTSLSEADLDDLAAALDGRRGLVVAGPGPLSQRAAREAVSALCRATGWPLLAESTSQLRHGLPADLPLVDGFPAALTDPAIRADLAPEVVVQIGSAPIAGAWERYLAAHPEAEIVVLSPHGWRDPTSRAAWMVQAELAPLLDGLARRLTDPVDPGWAARWAEADARAWQTVDAVLPDHLDEAHAARGAVAAVPEGGLLVLGNSLAIRWADLFAPARTDLRVLSQTGANGIDGLISGAAGAAAAAGRPTLLLLGDVSALHDLNGLLVARDLEVPLAVVVLQNGGGRIFELLPVARDPAVPPEALVPFTTPHEADLAAVAPLYGVRHVRVDTVGALEGALADALGEAGCTVVEAVVPPHGAARRLAALTARLAD